MTKSGWSGVTPDQWVEKTLKKLDLAVQKISIEMFSRIILRSPVDTGRFRANWQVEIGTIPDGVLDLYDESPNGIATINAATAVALNVKAGDIITLVNNLPYAQVLEEGHSTQAPQGMVALTIQEFQEVAKKVGLELVQL